MFSLDWVIFTFGLIGGVGWVLSASTRLLTVWTKAAERKGGLEKRQAELKAELDVNLKEVARYESDFQEAKARVDTLNGYCAEKRKEIEELKPPAITEIQIASEYPPGKGDKAWLVMLVRSQAARARGGPPIPPQQFHMIWASDLPTAQSRAGTTLGGTYSDYEVSKVSRFGL